MRVAVTGAAGFIGRSVLDALARRDVETIAICRRTPETPLRGAKQVVTLDIADFGDADLRALGPPDVLLHLAWGGLPNYRSRHHFENELPSHYAFLKRMVESGLQSLVVAGTCFEYGMQSGPLSEDIDTRPDNCYGFAKDVLRRELEFLRQDTPFNFSWARLFYPYGAGQGPQSLLSQLRQAVGQGEPVFNMSGGEQLRDYLPVEIVAQRLVDLAFAQADCGPVNICAGKPISIRALVESWLAENQWEIALNLGHYPYPDYEPMAFWGCPKKQRRVLGLTSD